MNPLKVTAISHNITWGDVKENLQSVNHILELLPKDTDVVVLPELFSTGFLNNEEMLRRCADNRENSPTLDSLLKWARKYNFALAGSMAVREGDNYMNRGFFIEPSGEMTFYDKRHLFCLSAESTLFKAGREEVPVVRFRGWNIALAVCYDLRFPAWLRTRSKRSYDLLIIPANWPVSRLYAWEHLLIARAIENQAYVVGANRSGVDDDGDYDNATFIFNYMGQPIGTPEKMIAARQNVVTAILDGTKLLKYRERFPAWRDADAFRFDI